MNLNKELLNEIPSPLDPRDVSIEEIISEKGDIIELPKIVDHRNDLPNAWDQLVDGPCSAYSAAAIKQYHEFKNYKLKKDLSKRFIYILRKNFPAKGMFARDTMDILLNHGIPLEKTFKYKFRKKEDIPQEVYNEASNHKISAYARIYTIEGLKRALYDNGPCYIAFPVYSNEPDFWNSRNNYLMGGHACVVVGYNEQGFIIRNSWGHTWADKGHSIYSYKDWGVHYEVWTLVDDLTSIEIIKKKVKEREGLFKKVTKFVKKIFKK